MNPNTAVQGAWSYDLKVKADGQISVNTAGGTFTTPTSFTEALINSYNKLHKVVYTFSPKITVGNGGSECAGPDRTITIWVNPKVTYSKDVSNFNGVNISCYGNADGYIRISPAAEQAPYIYNWNGPNGFKSSDKDITGLRAGQYTLTLTDANSCSVTETFDLKEPLRLSMTITKAVSADGGYNINCAGSQTGVATVSAVNNVGAVRYLWNDGFVGNNRPTLTAGTYKIIVIDANNCQADSTLTLTEPELIKINFDVTEPFCPDKPDGAIASTVTGGIPGDDFNYKWSENSTGKNISNILEGRYKLTVTDLNGCIVSDSLYVNSLNETCLIIPNAISPNGDLINDVWNIGNIDLYPDVVITIFNNWGEMLWKSEKGYPHPWDGKSNGAKLPIDSYYYVIDLHNGSRPVGGSVTIIR